MMVLFALVTMVSCKDKLPENISSAVRWSEVHLNSLNEVDSVIIKLTDKDIENISVDSARSLYVRHNISYDEYNSSIKEIDELLKYNAEYSNYDELKNRKYHFTIENRLRWEQGQGLIKNNVDKLMNKVIFNEIK